MNENRLTCSGPTGSGTLDLSSLTNIEIQTTDEGPFQPDVFWIVRDSKVEVRFPQGAEGEDKVRDHFYSLPGFDLEASIAASFSAERQLFHCWPKS